MPGLAGSTPHTGAVLSDSLTPAEVAAVHRAVGLADLGAATALPNPVVGCVLLAPGGWTVGEGFHERPGGPHAEVAALSAAGPLARGATAVVTLEPCNHTGRTGPCSEALIAAGVTRVIVAVRDPWPPAAGGIAPAAGRPASRWSTCRRSRRGRRSAGGAPRGRRRRGRQPGLADRDAAGPAVRHLEGRHDHRRPGRGRRRRPAGGSPRRSPARTCTPCGPGSTPSWSASAPCWPTTRS